ncbi:MAG: UDP-2,3-diacylglucosamine diphosphatase [Burkholderiales bacterium]|nr:UDP-2,3-diacylglucosamine diphosphatase [Burkholderiales bacterium]
MAALFVADLHLAEQRPAGRERFLRFLREVPAPGDSLYVLGDLFEYWAGDDDIDAPVNRAVVDALAACAARGTTSFWIAGNRDFLAGPAFAAAARMCALAEPCVVELHGERTVLLHGDLLCTDDRAYQAFRAESRSAHWQRAFLARPLAERRAAIASMRARSEAEKATKPADIMDANPDAVAATFAATGATRMIHGHTHRPACHETAAGATRLRRWVLPAWDDAPGYLRVDAAGVRAADFP